MTLFITAIALALGISAICSLFEAVLYSTRSGHLEAAKNKGIHEATIFASLKERVDLPIAAILILNTLANTIGAAVAGSQSRVVLGEQWVIWFSLSMAAGILFFSEILPKTIGAAYWASLWRWVARPLRWIVWILYPIIMIARQFTKLITGKKTIEMISEDELKATAGLAYRHGQILQLEKELVANVLRLNDIRVRDILTPRVVMRAESADLPLVQAQKEAQTWYFSRIPIYEDNIDNIIGYVLRRDVLTYKNPNPDVTLRQLSRKIYFVPETVDCYRLLNKFIKDMSHIFMVVDEYGGIEGLVTLEDVLEQMVGSEIVDELDIVDNMRKLAKMKSEITQKENEKSGK